MRAIPVRSIEAGLKTELDLKHCHEPPVSRLLPVISPLHRQIDDAVAVTEFGSKLARVAQGGYRWRRRFEVRLRADGAANVRRDLVPLDSLAPVLRLAERVARRGRSSVSAGARIR